MRSQPLIFKVHFPTVRSGSYLPINAGSNPSFSLRQTPTSGKEIRVRVSRLVFIFFHLLLLLQILFGFSFFYFTTNRISDLSVSVSHQIKERSKQKETRIETMAGGFMNRILYYVINEVVVNGLANRYIQTPSFYHSMFLTLYLIKDETFIHQAMCFRCFLIDPDEIGVGIIRNPYVSGDMTCFG